MKASSSPVGSLFAYGVRYFPRAAGLAKNKEIKNKKDLSSASKQGKARAAIRCA